MQRKNFLVVLATLTILLLMASNVYFMQSGNSTAEIKLERKEDDVSNNNFERFHNINKELEEEEEEIEERLQYRSDQTVRINSDSNDDQMPDENIALLRKEIAKLNDDIEESARKAQDDKLRHDLKLEETESKLKSEIEKLKKENEEKLKKEVEKARAAAIASIPSPAPSVPSIPKITHETYFGLSDAEKHCEETFGFESIEKVRGTRVPICNAGENIISGGDVYTLNSKGIGIVSLENAVTNIRDIVKHRELILDCNRNPKAPGLSVNCLPFPIRSSWTVQNLTEMTIPTEERFVLFVQRDGSSNLFHCTMDHIMAFHSLAVLGVHDREVLVVLTDNDANHPNVGQYAELWGAISKYPAVMARDYDKPGAVLLRKAAFASTGGCSFGWLNRRELGSVSCPGFSLAIRSFARNLLQGLDLLNIPPPTKPTILFISRKINLERNQPRVGRQVKNENELIEALKCDKSISVQLIDFATISAVEQIKLVRSSNILVGMHGAALTHLMYLPEEAVVVEMFPMNWNADSFRSLARMSGKTYISWQNQNKDNHFQDHGIEAGKGDKQASTIVDVKEFVHFMDIAINIARNFNEGFDQRGLSRDCKKN